MEDNKTWILLCFFLIILLLVSVFTCIRQWDEIKDLSGDNYWLSKQVGILDKKITLSEDSSKTVGERYNLTLVPYTVYYKCNDNSDFIVSIAIGIMDTKDYYHQTDIDQLNIYGEHETDDVLLRSQIYNKMRFHNIDLGSDNNKYSASVFDSPESFVVGNLSCAKISD